MARLEYRRIGDRGRHGITSRHSCKSVCLIAIVIAAFGMPAQAQTTQNIDHNSLLLPYLSLLNSPDVMAKNLQQAISINNLSTPAQRNLAIADNLFALDNGSIVADGLGTGLDRIYQNAIKQQLAAPVGKQRIVQTFRQANGIATTDAALSKIYFFNGTRAVTGTHRERFAAISGSAKSNPEFRPGPASTADRQSRFPERPFRLRIHPRPSVRDHGAAERYQQLLTRASEYGNSRIVLGAHYPLDIIAGPIIATYDVAQLLNNNPKF